MIPLRDHNPTADAPLVTYALIAVNIVVFLYQFSLLSAGPQAAEAFVMSFGAVPAHIGAAIGGDYPVLPAFAPVVTSMFLHGGFMHLIGNMWFLWIFGDNVEDELGHVGYLAFYLACGVMASLAHFMSDPASAIPAIGASGAISGVMGAYLIRFPHARVTTLIPLFIIFTTVELPAALILVYWFAIQFFSGAASFGAEGGGVAWWAFRSEASSPGARSSWPPPRKPTIGPCAAPPGSRSVAGRELRQPIRNPRESRRLLRRQTSAARNDLRPVPRHIPSARIEPPSEGCANSFSAVPISMSGSVRTRTATSTSPST